MKLFIAVVSLLLGINSASSQGSYMPKEGIVSSDTTAIKIAEAICLPIYGKVLYEERPFRASLIGDSVWVVSGSLKPSSVKTVDGTMTYDIYGGGTFHIEIRKRDCQIVKLYHSR